MKKILLVFALVFAVHHAKAQFVTIPDPGFVTFLQNNYSCMNGNQMDTTSADVVNETYFYISTGVSISDLTGIEYFKNLKTINIEGINLVNLSSLPEGLTLLNCHSNSTLTSLPPLPSTLKYIWCNDNGLTSLPTLPDSLLELIVWNNNLISLPSLPNSLEALACDNNNLTYLPYLT